MWLGDVCCCVVFFFKQKTAYEMRISDWSSDVCSSDLQIPVSQRTQPLVSRQGLYRGVRQSRLHPRLPRAGDARSRPADGADERLPDADRHGDTAPADGAALRQRARARRMVAERSEEHTSELQSLMRISYAVFCLKKK